jgi:hypothetical protein
MMHQPFNHYFCLLLELIKYMKGSVVKLDRNIQEGNSCDM